MCYLFWCGHHLQWIVATWSLKLIVVIQAASCSCLLLFLLNGNHLVPGGVQGQSKNALALHYQTSDKKDARKSHWQPILLCQNSSSWGIAKVFIGIKTHASSWRGSKEPWDGFVVFYREPLWGVRIHMAESIKMFAELKATVLTRNEKHFHYLQINAWQGRNRLGKNSGFGTI